MKLIKAYTLGLVLASLTLLITACSGGGSSALVAPPNPNVALTASYKVEYVPGAPANPTMGKTTFQLRITKLSDGLPADKLDVSLEPMMHMTVPMPMDHSTPVDVVTESSTPGTYDCTVYYIMASSSMDTWELNVMVSGETATFSPSVGGMISIPKLRGQTDDLITKMTGTETRSYLLLKDGPTTTTSISLFIAAQGNDKMTFSQVYSGATFTDETDSALPITDVLVEASTAPLISWVSGTNAGTGGHWTLPISPNLSSGGTGTVYVRLFVNGTQKSTDGKLVSVPTDSNGYQTFFIEDKK
jgi:hypothetical protein